MEYKDYYKILGVSKSADESEIKRAYRKLARQYHPDRNPGNRTAEERFKEINEAYEVLGNADNRARYDQLGRNYHRYRQMGGNAADFDFSQWFGGAANRGGYRQTNVNFDNLGGFSDFFSAIFGGGMGRGRGQAEPFGRSAQAPNRDVEQPVEITLEEAYHGTKRSFNRQGHSFTATIPPGARNGTKVRLRGKGNAGPDGIGDLYLIVQVSPHPTFRPEGDNLHTSVTVDVLTAVLGGQVTVPTMTGDVNLTIPAGTQGGQTFRLKGKGMPRLRHKGEFGDLLTTVQLRVPTELSAEERALYQQLANLASQRDV